MANSLPKYHTKTLPNGLQVVAIPMQNGTNVISTNIIYKVGSANEQMGKSGIAHMLEHLNFKSTQNLKAGEFDEIVKRFGGVNNASTSFDYTQYFIKSSSKNLGKSLELFAELMGNLKLLDEEFQPERDVVAEERRWRTDNNPMGYLQFRLFNNAYIYHPYHWTPIGFTNDIKNWKIEDIKEFHSTYYQPKNAIILVAGDINAEAVFESAEKYFGKIENKIEQIPEIHTTEPKLDGEKRAVIYKESEVEMLAIAYHIPNFAHSDMVALSAISELLSYGQSSRLQKKLIDEKKLVNSIYAYPLDLKYPGLFLIMAICNENVDAQKAEKEILAEIEKLKNELISKDEIDKLIINTKAQYIFSLESSSSVANLFSSYLARGDLEPLMKYEEEINNLSKDKIQEIAKKYLNKQNSLTMILRKEDKKWFYQ